MSIIQAEMTDVDVVRKIVHSTISEIYPHYYPWGAVDFFLKHHSDENIKKDISEKMVWLWCDDSKDAVGTVTINKNEICRLFVLPGYQGKGYGKCLLVFAQSQIAKYYDEIILDASLSAKSIYLKMGFKEIEYHTITTDNGDRLCYDVMKMKL